MTTMVSQQKLGVPQQHELLLAFQKAGLTRQFAQLIINSKDNALAQRIVQLIQEEDGIAINFQESPGQVHARKIMGPNFLGIPEAIQHFYVTPNTDQLEVLGEIPFSAEVLEACKDTHLLVAVFPISILDIRGRIDEGIFYQQDWYDTQAFAQETGETRWCLIRKNEVPDSITKNWQEQLALLTKTEEVPTAQQLTYLVILNFLVTGERLFPEIYVRTSSLGSDGVRVRLGRFDDKGLYLSYYWDVTRFGYLAVSSARKPI